MARAALVAAVLALALAAPAGAYVRDFQVNEMSAPFGDANRKTVQLGCPPDATSKLPIGAGANARKGANLAINQLIAHSPSPGIFVSANETDPAEQGKSWSFTGQAFCVRQTDLPPSVGPGPNYLKDVLISRSSFKASDRNSDSSKLKEVACVPPRIAVGAGFDVDEPASHRAVAAQSVVRFNDKVRVGAQATDSGSGSWAVAPYAICANVTTAASTSTYVGTPTSVFEATKKSSADKGRTVKCPSGQSLIGGGAQIRGPNGPPPEDVVLAASRPVSPNSAFAHFFSTEWYARAVEVDPTSASWQLEVRAFCAPPEPFR